MSTLPDEHQDASVARRRFINPPPSQDGEFNPANIAALKREFAKRLQAKLVEKGWNQSDFARAAAKHMPNKKFNRDNVSLYIRAEQLPGPVRLAAMLAALGCTKEELLPTGAVATVDEKAPPPLAMYPTGNPSIVMLHINQAVDQDLALKILGMLRQTHIVKK